MPKIISFGWTWPALVAGKKTVTRREWNYAYAESFMRGEICQAWDFSPRSGHGKRIGEIRIVSVAREPLISMADEDYRQEGFHFLDRHQDMIPDAKDSPIAKYKNAKRPCREFFEGWRKRPDSVWVVRFVVLKIDLSIKESLGFIR